MRIVGEQHLFCNSIFHAFLCNKPSEMPNERYLHSSLAQHGPLSSEGSFACKMNRTQFMYYDCLHPIETPRPLIVVVIHREVTLAMTPCSFIWPGNQAACAYQSALT
jgi:hypothetical protein